jgi:quercetin dioxygenase-like cupin family protein
MDVFPTKEAAESAKGSGGTVVESLGKVWLLTVGEKLKANPAGTRVTEIGPLPLKVGQNYTAQYMEATLQPGMVSKTHVHAGVEAFYTESGETCLETPEGKQVGRKGDDIVIPEGVSMELTATGTEVRRGMMLVLHDSSKPSTTLVDDWKSKGLCKAAK